MDKSLINISNEVKLGLKNKKPIVALESTLISHGLPYPENVKVAKSSINAVKNNGVIPATIGIINGKIKVGLNEDEIIFFAKNKNIHKVTMNNLALTINNRNNGATTVGSTINIAAKLGIKFFATGGIGGVHLNSEKTMDISSDLYELSKNNIFVVCSGAKSILDINKTYEKLESLGIPRIGYKINYMPGFWYYETNNEVDNNFERIKDLVKYLKTTEKLNNKTSILLFNQIKENETINKIKINKWIKLSLKKAEKLNLKGKKISPFLISEINKLSKNKTLDVNMRLIINNANLAGKLAYNYFIS